MSLLITPLFLSAFIGMHIFLSFQVIKQRRKHKVRLGDAGLAELQNTMRAQANFAEYVPIFVLALLVLELQKTHWLILLGLSLVMLVGRASHAYSVIKYEGLHTGQPHAFRFRIIGMQSTFWTLGLASMALLVSVI